MRNQLSRRNFIAGSALGLTALSGGFISAAEKPIEGFDRTETEIDSSQVWKPFSDRKVKMGIVGYGVCRFGAAFGYQDHPNVEVAAVSPPGVSPGGL